MTRALGIAGEGIRVALIGHSILSTVLLNPEGEHRVFLEAARGLDDMPYVRMVHIQGGFDNRSTHAAFDIYWRVTAVAETSLTALTYANFVDEALRNKTLTYLENFTDYATCRSTGEYSDKLLLQGAEFWEIGGFYRTRGVSNT